MVTTVTIWLLISIGNISSYSAAPTQIVERFATEQECQRVAMALFFAYDPRPRLKCIQASVAKL